MGSSRSTQTIPVGDEHRRVSEIQRARILVGLVEVVGERGMANVTVANIVGRSGVSRRTFYELFEDRDDCFLAAFDDAVGRIEKILVRAYTQPGSWRSKIRASLEGLLGFIECEPDTARLLIVESLGAGTVVLERRRILLERITTVVDEGRAEAKPGVSPPVLVAEGVVGGVLSVLHARLLADRDCSLTELTSPLMSMIVLPYLGQSVAQEELARPAPQGSCSPSAFAADPLRDVDMRLTYRTVRVLMAIAEQPGASNREIGQAAGMSDQGQISKLLLRLKRLGLVENSTVPGQGTPNAWTLTLKGQSIQRTIEPQTTLHPVG